MILGVFSRDVPESKARAALDRLRATVVDYNELRVVPPIEMTELVGALPDARLKCEDLSRALNRVFALEHEVSLERLREMSRREVAEYLDEVDGLDAYSRARVRLLGLQQHAVPLDEAMWAFSRKEKIIDRNCSLEEAQAFLERRIPDGEALEFVGLIEKQSWSEMGAAVRNGEVERIISIPPDRTARNMLQMVASGRSVTADASSTEDEGESAAVAKPGAKPKRKARPRKAKKPKPAAKSRRKKSAAKAASRKRKSAAKAARRPKRKPAAKRRARKTTTPARKKTKKKPTRAKAKRTTRGRVKARKKSKRVVAKRVRRPIRKAKSA
jgi:hypothetical protein